MTSAAVAAEVNRTAGLKDNYEAWKRDLQSYDESKKNL